MRHCRGRPETRRILYDSQHISEVRPSGQSVERWPDTAARTIDLMTPEAGHPAFEHSLHAGGLER